MRSMKVLVTGAAGFNVYQLRLPELVDVAAVADAVTFRNFLARRLVRKDMPKPEYRQQTTGTQENRFHTEANA